MRLTERDRQLLKKLRALRWLSPRQAAATALHNVRRRLRILRSAASVRSSRTPWPRRFMPGPASRHFFPDGNDPRTRRLPPQNLEHFLGVNDLRIAVERSAERDGITMLHRSTCRCTVSGSSSTSASRRDTQLTLRSNRRASSSSP